MGKFKGQDVESKKGLWLDRQLIRFFTWLMNFKLSRKRFSAKGFLWRGFDQASVKKYLKSLPDDEVRTRCGTCGGRLD